MDGEIVISGTGVVSSIGDNFENFCDSLFASKSNYQPHKDIPDSELAIHRLAYVNDKALTQSIGTRQARKLDRFCLLSMGAFFQAHTQAQLTPEVAANFGILIGNSTGGWQYVEHQMDGIASGDFDSLSPYVATAWFPTAAQGEISINYGLGGYSKTFSSGNLSAAYALQHGMYLIKHGYLKGIFVAGAESPISPLVYNSFVHTNTINLKGESTPCQKQLQGCLLGEGSSVLCIEKYQDCINRGSTPLVKVCGCSREHNLITTIKKCLKESNKTPSDIDVIVIDGQSALWSIQQELDTLSNIFSLEDVALSYPKTLYGNTIGADFAFQILVSTIILQKQQIPQSLDYSQENTFIKDPALNSPINTVLTYSSCKHGHMASIFERI